MDQNVDFSGADQIQNPQYPDIHPLSQENPLMNDEFEAYTNANDANMNDLQFKLDNIQKNQRDFQKKFKQMQDDLLNQMRNFMQMFTMDFRSHHLVWKRNMRRPRIRSSRAPKTSNLF
nr:hypothetical protein [Tanacetum cinerariifolium]